MTPFIDVIFLLTLFFVLNTSFRQDAYLDVSLPKSETSENIQVKGIVMTLRKDGTVTIEDQDVAWESVTATIRQLVKETGSQEVIIRGDENVAYGRTIEALDFVRMAGLENISLQTIRSDF